MPLASQQEGQVGKPTISRLRVRFAETDAMGVVYHTNYAVWLEVGRGEYFREHGMSYAKAGRQGIHFPATELRVRYHAPARFDDEILVETQFAAVRSRAVTFQCKVRSGTDRLLLASGTMSHLCTDADGNVRVVPEAILAHLSAPLG